MPRSNGPICGAETGPGWMDPGTLARSRSTPPRVEGGDLDQADRALLLDLSQMVLDLAGVLDPTPVSDGTNVLLSLARGDWTGAGLSGLGLIPYVGDLAKAGKLGRWAHTVQKAVERARRSPAFAQRARAPLRMLAKLLDQIPPSLLPSGARGRLLSIRRQIDFALGAPVGGLRGARLLERYRHLWHGFIDELDIPAPARDAGVLWAKLGESGWELAATLASQKGIPGTTLEMALARSSWKGQPARFAERYELAVAQLKESLGKDLDVWEHFGAEIWAEVSSKFAQKLSGRVTIYANQPVLQGTLGNVYNREVGKAVRNSDFPVLMLELREILSRSPKVTGIDLKHIERH